MTFAAIIRSHGIRAGVAAALIAAVAVAGFAVSALINLKSRPASEGVPIILWHATPQDLPATIFFDDNGVEKRLSDFGGKVLVVNFWATWCGPCAHEMPTLDALQTDLGTEKFQVLAINQDREGRAIADPFVAKNGWKNISFFTEADGHFQKDADVGGLPTSLIVDKHGKEVGRLQGDTTWSAAPLEAKLRALIDAP